MVALDSSVRGEQPVPSLCQYSISPCSTINNSKAGQTENGAHVQNQPEDLVKTEAAVIPQGPYMGQERQHMSQVLAYTAAWCQEALLQAEDAGLELSCCETSQYFLVAAGFVVAGAL